MKALFISKGSFNGYKLFASCLKELDISLENKKISKDLEEIEGSANDVQIVFLHHSLGSGYITDLLRSLRSINFSLPVIYVYSDREELSLFPDVLNIVDGSFEENSSQELITSQIRQILSGSEFFLIHREVLSHLEYSPLYRDLAFDNYKADLCDRPSYVKYLNMIKKTSIFKYGETFHHMARVGIISKLIALRMGLDGVFCNDLEFAAPLHDIGMTLISEEIYSRRGVLSFNDWSVIRTHSERGADLIGVSTCPVLKMAKVIAKSHHERWDGKGYPSGARQGNIPTAGLITALADSFDVMVSSRHYKKEIMIEEAFDNVKLNSGSQFCPMCVYSLLNQKDEVKDLYMGSAKSLSV